MRQFVFVKLQFYGDIDIDLLNVGAPCSMLFKNICLCLCVGKT